MLQAPVIEVATLKAKLFRGLADPSRLAILQTLLDGPLAVGAIVLATGLSQSNVSNHLSCLWDCGLVAREQQGRTVYYRLSDERVADLLRLAAVLLIEVATSVYECVRYTRLRRSISGGN